MSKADESLKTLETAEKLYLDAIEKAGYAYVGRKLVLVKKDDEEIDSTSQKGYNSDEIKLSRRPQYKKISQEQYSKLSSIVMDKVAPFMAKNQEVQRYDTATTWNYFYIYENFGGGNFGVLKQIENTDKNREYINAIRNKIGESNETTIRSTSELNRVLKILKSKGRSNNSNNAVNTEGRTNSGNGGLSIEESENNGKRNPQTSSSYKRKNFSLKDSDGNELSPEQQEYFKNSKAITTILK